jgi:dihydrofolate reductase
MSIELPPLEPFAIVAYDEHRAIGYGDMMPYDARTQLKSDNTRMWDILTNPDRPVSLIGGRATVEPMLPVILGKGINDVIVLSHTERGLEGDTRVQYVASPEEALRLAKHTPAIFGGAATYAAMLPYLKWVLATEVHHTFSPVDKFFPALPAAEWCEKEREPLQHGPHDAFAANFVTYQRV